MKKGQDYSTVGIETLAEELRKGLQGWSVLLEDWSAPTLFTPEGIRILLYPKYRQWGFYNPSEKLPSNSNDTKSLIRHLKTTEFRLRVAKLLVRENDIFTFGLYLTDNWKTKPILRRALVESIPPAEGQISRTARNLLLGRECDDSDKNYFYDNLKFYVKTENLRKKWLSLLLLTYSRQDPEERP